MNIAHVTVIIALAISAGTSADNNPATTGKAAPVARVRDQTISLADLEEKAAKRLIILKSQQYDVLRLALNDLVYEALLKQEAQARKLSVEELKKQEVEAKTTPVTD